MARTEEVPGITPRHIEIPVCYGGDFGPDLEVLAQLHGITSEQAVELHASVEYVAYFLGFVPAFAYLGGLPAPGDSSPGCPAAQRACLAVSGSREIRPPLPGDPRRLAFDRPYAAHSLPPRPGGHEPDFHRRSGPLSPNIGGGIRCAGQDMSTIAVEAPWSTTVQDLGREGFGPLGVSPSGAADSLSLRLGNRLVGNPDNNAGLEMTLLGGTFVFPQGGVFALSGSNFAATMDGVPITNYTSTQAHAGQSLSLGHSRSGARCYLCVRGGISVPPFLGSSSTHLLSGLGGFSGRALRKGDVLQIGPYPAGANFKKRIIPAGALAQLSPRRTIRVTSAPQANWFPKPALRLFYDTSYQVTEQSDRMGIRLAGPSIVSILDKQMITEGLPLGAIQMPVDGQPIVMFVEQQTTGGYAKIAT